MLLPQSSAARPVTLPMPAAAVGAGFVPGTRVATDQGVLPIEHLFAGDRIAVHGGGFATLRRIERVRLLGAEVAVLAPGALPGQDGALVVPAAHPVLAGDWRAQVVYGASDVLTPAGRLADGGAIRRETRAVLTLLRLTFDKPQLIRAEGAWLACATPTSARPALLH